MPDSTQSDCVDSPVLSTDRILVWRKHPNKRLPFLLQKMADENKLNLQFLRNVPLAFSLFALWDSLHCKLNNLEFFIRARQFLWSGFATAEQAALFFSGAALWLLARFAGAENRQTLTQPSPSSPCKKNDTRFRRSPEDLLLFLVGTCLFWMDAGKTHPLIFA